MSVGNMGMGTTKSQAVVRDPAAEDHNYQVQCWTIVAVLLAVLAYCYGNTLMDRIIPAWDNPQYSHGWLIPAFTAVLIWMRREPFKTVDTSARWAGVGLLGLGLLIRLTFTYFQTRTPEMYSLIPCVMGIFLLVGGWPTMRWAGPPILFLFFMFPMPSVVDEKVLEKLQVWATIASTYCLQTLGIASYRDGNTIFIGDIHLGVVEACSGLRMLTIFVAFSVAIILVTDRPWWERVAIFLSSFVIALIVNVIRITVTGVLHLTAGTYIAEKVFHDLAGYVMMPMALGFMYVEFQILSHLIIDEGPSRPVKIGAGVPRPEVKKQVVKPTA